MATTKSSSTPQLDALIAKEPDLVDRIFEYLIARHPGLAGLQLAETKKAVREEFAGQDVYIPVRSPTARQELAQSVLALFNGDNATEVARELQISRATVYRVLKQDARRRRLSQLSGK